jgi:hypothetical protein
MNISKLLRFLLAQYLAPGIVETGGGSAAEDDSGEAEESDSAGAGDEEDQGGEGGESGEAEGAEAGDEGESESGATDEVVVTIGDEPAAGASGADDDENRAPEWVRDLRKSNREKDRKLREQEQEIARLKGTGSSTAVVLGEKPTLAGCDYDEPRYEREYADWQARKAQIDEQARTRAAAEEAQQKRWATRVEEVDKAASGLKVKDQDDAIAAFEDSFSLVQRGIIMGGPDDAKTSALLRYALGKNPKKAKELAAISDPVKFVFAVARLESQLKVTPRKTAPAPDTPVRSGVSGAAAIGDKELQRLQDQADKTGDRSKVAAYLRSKAQRAKQAA